MRDTVNKVLTPVMLPTRVPPALDYILMMIKCSCGSCGSAPCSCVYHLRSHVPSSAGAMAAMIVLTVVILPLKCQIQMMIRKMTNKGIKILDYVNIFMIIRVIAIRLN